MDTPRKPYLWEALLSLLSLVVGIALSIVKFGTEPHIAMLFGVLVASIVAWRCGYNWKSIQNGMVQGITNSLPAIIILVIIGILIGVWIASGVVPTLLYYGLKLLSPSIFLPAALIICAVTSVATGTSWGTTGTIGVALMGIGDGLGFPLPVVAGAVLSGAYFGDKMSPLSDTTNMTPAMVGTDLYTHIKHMSYTTGVAFALTLIIEIVLGLSYSGGDGNLAEVQQIIATLDGTFWINPLMLLPAVLVIVVAYRKVPAIPGITAGALAAIIMGLFLQDGTSLAGMLDVSYAGYTSETGIGAVDDLLTKGGMSSMMYTISIVIAAMMFGGVMEKTDQLRVIVDRILQWATSQGSLFGSVVGTALISNMVLCDQYMSIVMTARMYSQAFRDRGLHPKNLSRAVEDSATVTANLVPWNSGGAYQTATLGVATILYLPFAFFCWLSPIVTLIYGIFNITIEKSEDDPDSIQDFEPAGEKTA
ncbi:MAG: Na+/H+ antiporter NhaC [Gammaproteobacteria bacterium]|nr:Na+/H+ antiporter NhaC [Gammaproteobacteria bacterium]